MADIILSVTIPSGKVEVNLPRWLAVHPNSEIIKDPDWVDPKDGSPTPYISKYPNVKDWIVEMLRRSIVNDCERGKYKIAQNEVTSLKDNDVAIVTLSP